MRKCRTTYIRVYINEANTCVKRNSPEIRAIAWQLEDSSLIPSIDPIRNLSLIVMIDIFSRQSLSSTI